MFIGLTLLLASAGATAQSSPPLPADERVRCVVGDVAASDRATITQFLLHRGNRTREYRRAQRRYLDSVARCARSARWTADDAASVSGAGVSYLVLAEAPRHFAAAGVDPAAVDRWFAQQPESFRLSPIAPGDAERIALLARQMPEALFVANDRAILAYIEALKLVERFERGLPLR